MSRDQAGNYTLPAGNPVITDTTITTQWANSTLSDIATALTNSLSRNGRGGMEVPLQFADGSANDPSITFVTDTNTGFFLENANDMRVTVNQTAIMRWRDAGATDGKIVEIYDEATTSWAKIVTGTGTAVNQTLRWEGSKWTPTSGLSVSASGLVGIGHEVVPSAFYKPRAVISHINTGTNAADLNLALGNVNPSMLFISDLDVTLPNILSAKSSLMGLVTTPTASTWNANLTAGDFVISSQAVSVFSQQGFGTGKSLEVGNGGRTSINVFNKLGSETVTTRTNNAQLIVASPMQAKVVTPATIHSIIVTDNRFPAEDGYGPGNGGSIAFASGTNTKDGPVAFATIRGYIEDNDRETKGALEFHVREFVGSSGFPTDQNLVARLEGGSVECVAPLILWYDYDVATPANSLRGIVSDAGYGFNYQELSRAQGHESLKAFGFTKSGLNYYAHVNGGAGVQIGTASDYRAKDEIGLLENGVDTIKLMRPIEYTEKEGEQYKIVHQGFIAHEMQAIIPSIVSGEKDALNEDGEINPQSLYYAGLTPILVKAVQELTARIEALEA